MRFSRHNWRHFRLLRIWIVFCITVLLVVISPAIAPPFSTSLVPSLAALAQFPPLAPPANNNGQSLPTGVERRGTLESAPIRLDGKELFRIASPAVFNRNDPGSQIPVEVRAKQVESNLNRLVPGSAQSDEISPNPETLRVVIETINGQPVLFVEDTKLPEARVLLTVTDADAQYAAAARERLAEQWREILERELRLAIALRQPEAFRQQVFTVLMVAVATVLLTLAETAIWAILGRRKKRLEQQLAAKTALIQAATKEMSETESGTESEPLHPQEHPHFLNLQRRLQIVRLMQWLLFWTIALVWVFGVAYSLYAFPQTRQFARQVVTIPVVFLLAWFFTGLINRLIDIAIDRYLQNQEQSLTEANLQRAATIARVIKGLKMVLLYTVVLLSVLQWLNLVPGSVLTLGAVFALVVSFAAQSLVRDLVNGFLILLEDQFRIGDNVRIGTVSGMVEHLDLRITQLRSDDGNLITLPNSLITEVENRSRGWARADFRVEVAYQTDVDRAMFVVRETVDQMAEDPQWQSVIYDTHELFGVDQISHTGIVIRMWIKTAPLKQWNVARELRRRMKIAFDQHHIAIGIPQQIQFRHGLATPEQPSEQVNLLPDRK